MGQSLGELYAELSLKTDKLHDGIEKSNRELAKLEQDIDKTVESINAKLKSIGTALSVGVTLPLTLLGKAALDTFANFEQSMQNTFSVMGASASEMEALRKKAEDMGATTRFSASQAADALYSLGSAGQTAAQAMNSLDGVLQLAGATGSDLAFTSSTIASTLSQFNLSAEKSAHIADVFSLAISKSQANMTKLSYSMKYVGPVAAGLGVSLEASTAALMRLYNTGFGGEQAGTILRSGLQKLASGTDDVKKKLEALGVSYDEVNPKTNNFADIIERLKNANLDVAASSDLFGEAAAAGMQALIEGGGDAIRTMDGLLQASDGAAKKMQDIQNASFANTKAELSSAFEAVQITLTSNIIPAVDMFAKGITRVLQAVNDLPVGVQTTGTAFAALAAAAGPLLLVAVGIKKIKAEMVQLNIAMSANPIIAWGAAIAAAGAIALGIIAQVKKAHEDYIHGAKRSVEEVKKLKEDALKQGNEGRKIQSLFDEYTTLKNKTQRTADEQERYNNLLKELKTIVPSATEALDAQGQKVIQNEQAITEAIRKRIESEKILNNLALIKAKSNVAHAQSVLTSQGAKLPMQQAALEKAVAKMEQAANSYSKAQYLKSEYDLALLENRKDEATRIYTTLKNYADNARLAGDISLTRWDTTSIVQAFETVKTKAENTAESARAAFEKTAAAIQENEQAQRELNEAIEKQHTLETAEKNITATPQKKKHDEELARLEKEWEAEKNIIDEKNRYAQKMGESFSVPQERIKFLQAKLKELIAIKQEDIDTIFTLDSKGLQKYFDAIAQEQKKLEKGKGTKSASVKGKDTSYQAQIAELDKFYQDKIAKAKEYGQSSLAVEEEYQQKRLTLIEQFIKEEDKKKGAGKGITVETKSATKDEKGSGVTLGDELTKTKLMSDAFGRYQIKQKELQAELKKTQEEIQKTKALLEGETGAVSAEDAGQAKRYLEDLQEEANKLEIALGQSKYSLSQIDETLKNLDTVGKSDFQIRLINIEAERKKAHEVLELALTNGKIKDDKELARYKALADKQAAIAKTSMALGLVNGMLGVADTITRIISQAVEKGSTDAISIIRGINDTAGEIGSKIPNPIVQAIFSAVHTTISITTAIAEAQNKALEKKAQERKEKYEKEQKEYFDLVNQRVGGLLGDIAKRMSGIGKSSVNWKNALDVSGLEREKRKIDDFYKKLDNAETSETITETKTRLKSNGEGASKAWRVIAGLFSAGLSEIYYNKEQEEEYTETRALKLSEVLEKFHKAREEGNLAEADKLEKVIKDTMKAEAKKQGIDLDALDGIANYVQGLETSLANYIKTRDFGAFKKELRKALYDAIVQKAVFNSALKKVQENLSLLEQGKISQEQFDKSLEEMAKDAADHADRMAAQFGIAVDKDKLSEEWRQIGEAMSSALTTALGESAYNADWGSFKKSFAAEMKKAIIQSAVESAGIKKKVDAIIAEIMKDGKITTEEVTGTIDTLKNLYDHLEGDMAELSKLTRSLEGGVEVKTQAAGTIIQQLSGSDRDVLLEAIREGFKTINQSIDLKDATIQHLVATQIIINAVTFNSYNGTVNIYADKTISLQDLVIEITKEIIAGG